MLKTKNAFGLASLSLNGTSFILFLILKEFGLLGLKKPLFAFQASFGVLFISNGSCGGYHWFNDRSKEITFPFRFVGPSSPTNYHGDNLRLLVIRNSVRAPGFRNWIPRICARYDR